MKNKKQQLGVKICSKCGQELSVNSFHKDRSKEDGLHRHCRECRKEHYRKNRGQISLRVKECYKKNRDKILQRNKTYRRENHNEVLKSQKKYHKTIKGHLKRVFSGMNARCNNPNQRYFKNYGGRGIQNKFATLNSFRDYVTDYLEVDPRGLQIDRIDNNGNYEAGNIRFVTPKENCANRGTKYGETH